jgi:ribosomal protein S18 acetylase RimI-like enzyme
MTEFQRLSLTQPLINHCLDFFPEIREQAQTRPVTEIINGSFGSLAKWYGNLDPSGLYKSFCTIGQTNGACFLYNFAVTPKYRRQGQGTRFLNWIVENFNKDLDLYLFVRKDNRVAISLYRKFHFEYIGDAYKPQAGMICMVRRKSIDT